MAITSSPAQKVMSKKAGFSLTLACIGLIFIPIGFSVIAFLVGAASVGDFERRPELVGRGMANAGMLLGLAGVITGIAGWTIGRAYNWLIFYMY